MEPISVLVLCPQTIDRRNCKAIPDAEKYEFHFLDATLEASGLSPDFDGIKYLEQCRQYIQQHNIQVVLGTRDLPSLLQAQLSREFPHLRGPSLESSFLCLQKYYTHENIDFPSSQYALCRLNESKTVSQYLEEIEIPFPWIVKPCTAACSSAILKVNNPEEFAKAIAFYREYVVDSLQYLPKLLHAHIDSDRYPLIPSDTILVEEYIDYPYKCCVDGCVSHGEILIWSIADNHYYLTYPECFADYTFPSALPQPIQDNLCREYRTIVQQLIECGFDNQFIDVEFFVSDRGTIKLMEINGRMAPTSAFLYRQCLDRGDPYTALIAIGMGDKVKTPTQKPLVGGIFYLTSFARGMAKDLFDFELAHQFANLEVQVKPEQEITEVGASGFTLATMNLVGRSYVEIKEKADRIRRKLLKKPEFSPWN
ncbi:ATP-grasp domain-containing protein [Roseofilum casamattae]|uniref:ATP-grasp domain-containing protein n=1 Tax=Roseofilum casamattae BLCC-M143 TaxID=3022442 RepID=A0ABT7BX31_9CYAN|nr:ATP-grasp domain-containing protein [Roseofilum casamattae]MDJ1183750.1 ATP-grasp domain-containing protein [Roseofilum casamattae BLCC-M143]